MKHELKADDSVLHCHGRALASLQDDAGRVNNFGLLVVYHPEVEHRNDGTITVHQSIHIHVGISRKELLSHHFLETCKIGRCCVLSRPVGKPNSNDIGGCSNNLVGLVVERLVPFEELVKLVENGKVLH
jgi:hypothetical protein